MTLPVCIHTYASAVIVAEVKARRMARLRAADNAYLAVKKRVQAEREQAAIDGVRSEAANSDRWQRMQEALRALLSEQAAAQAEFIQALTA